MRNLHRMAALCAAAAGAALATPAPAHAASVFFGFGPPVYYAPPAYYPPPPVYYPPPPAYYPPPPPQYYTPPPPPYRPPVPRTTVATTCYAGPLVCPMETRVGIGTTCWCSNSAGGRTYGRAG